jgi:hypothetical protein
MPSYRVRAITDLYEQVSHRHADYMTQTFFEAILYNFPFQEAMDYIKTLFAQGYRSTYFFGGIYLPLMTIATTRINGRRPLILDEKRSMQRYRFLDSYLSPIPNHELPSLACLFMNSTHPEMEMLVQVAKIYGKKSAHWMRNMWYYNKAIATLEWLGDNPQTTDAFPEETKSLIPYAKLTQIPKVQAIQKRWYHRLYVLGRQDVPFKDRITVYGRQQLRIYS